MNGQNWACGTGYWTEVLARIGLRSKITDDYRVPGAGHYFVVGPDGLAVAAKAKLDEIEAAVERALSSKERDE